MPRGRIPPHGSPVERFRRRLHAQHAAASIYSSSTARQLSAILQTLIRDFDRIFQSRVPPIIQQYIDQYCYSDQTVCPICGCHLTQRRGQYGEFLGCSDYPRCHGSRKMDGTPSLNNALKDFIDKRRKEAGQSSSTGTSRFDRIEM